ncbi:MAG: hypothetical protein E7434_08115 [Ruminococcaceae bacterium]|nr:hypothetical protein [Oscillospiraceae bacterium]
MTKIYLIRHAEAEGNVFRRLQGQYDSFVTPNGRKQIEALKKRFESIHVDAVFASDLTRTRCTAGAIYKPKGLELKTDKRFREMSVGIWENLPFGWLDHSDPERNHDFSHNPETWHVENSERFEEYTARFLQALDEIAASHEGKTVVIVSHGMVLRGILQKMFYPNDRKAVAHCENTAVTHLTYENGSYRLEYLNDASHITPEISTLGRQMWWRGDGKKDFNMWYCAPTGDDKPLLQILGFAPEETHTVRISVLGGVKTGVVALEGNELKFLGLLEEHRGIGLSAQLLGEAVSIARSQGFETLRITQAVMHPAAQRLFKNYGFVDGVMPIIPHL